MELKQILADLGNVKEGMDKTAGEKTADVPQAQEELVTALNTALNAAETEKTAADTGGATDELIKMASDLATADQEALQKEAHLYGASVADGFMARLSQYTDVVADQPADKTASEKTASEAPTEAEFTKFAEENPELVKQAIELGYRDTHAAIESSKQAAAQKGYDDTVAAVKALAEGPDGETKLAELKAEVSRAVAETPEDQEKLAAVKQGYDDTVEQIEKVAADCYQMGYDNTVALLKEAQG